MKTTKQERLEHANALIRAIAAHGRRFFYYASSDRIAHMELDARGRVWYVDDYTQRRIYTHKPGAWAGFTKGGTLKGLVEQMRDYITRGERISRWHITMPREDGGNTWGYNRDAAATLRAIAYSMPIIDRDPNEPREYYVISEKHTRRDHRYITLWGPDDKGYRFRASGAGRYAEADIRAHLGYYNAGCNVAVPCDVLDPLMVMTTPADQLDGPDGPAILNTRENWKVILANVIAKPQYKPHPLYKGAPYNAYERECRGLPKKKEASCR